ncbi:hypothetical protein HYS92_01180 [Candidatus Daviesbacteria bacterium]|nr:hypothetical protein [Candidatus Daviesbacteria bacterium]
MAELSDRPPVEATPPPEGVATREQVMKAFNGTTHRWGVKIERLHRDIAPNIEIDDLADTGLLTNQQRNQFAAFRTFQKGLRGMSGHGILVITDRPEHALKTTFKNPETGEIYERNEGLDVSGLIASAKDDIANTKAELEQQRASRWSSPQMIERLEGQLRTYQEEARVLEDSSIPYTEAFPNALDESNPMEKSRIAEEARRIWKNPLTSTGSQEEDKQAAIARLKDSRLLQVPKKEETTAFPSKEVPQLFPSDPVRDKIGVVHEEMGHTFGGFAEEPAPAELPSDPAVIVIPPPSNGPRSSSESRPVTIEGKFSELEGLSYASRVREFMRDLIGIGVLGVDALVNKIRGFRERWGERESKVDPAIARKVDALMRIRATGEQRRRCRLAVLPLVLVLLAGIPRDTIGAVQSGQDSRVPASAGAGESGPKPPPETRSPFMTTEPTTLQEFASGRGLGNNQYAWNDFTIRDDFQEKIQPNNPSADPYNIEGYSVKGLAEADLAKAMNPDVAQEAAQLGSQNIAHSEGDPKMLKTLELLKKELDSYYGSGTFDQMVGDFTSRIRASIIYSKENKRPGLLSPVVDGDKIVLGNVWKMNVNSDNLDTWFKLKTAGSGLDPRKWQEISENITQQVREETQ